MYLILHLFPPITLSGDHWSLHDAFGTDEDLVPEANIFNHAPTQLSSFNPHFIPPIEIVKQNCYL